MTEGLALANLQLPYVSDGPIFSVLPEKIGKKRGAWMRLVQSASEFRRVPMFQFGVPLESHLTGDLLRAA